MGLGSGSGFRLGLGLERPLGAALVGDVALVRLHDHEDDGHAGRRPAGRGADPVGAARARGHVRRVRTW